MSLPGVTVSFGERAQTAIARSAKGAVGIIVKDNGATAGVYTVRREGDIPSGLSAASQTYVKRAMLGGANQPAKILLYVAATTNTSAVEDALAAFEVAGVRYVVGTPSCDATEAGKIAAWVGDRRALGSMVMAVLPNQAGNSAGIINFIADDIMEGSTEIDTPAYCSRIAGLIAGTPMTESITFKALPELSGVGYMSSSALETAIAAGKLCLFADGETIRVSSGVTSLVNATGVPTAFKKIKITEIVDMIATDIQSAARDNYIGRLPNSFDNKCVLIAAVQSYLETLETQALLEAGASTVDIDIAATEAYLAGMGVDTSGMTEDEIRRANTGDSVFLSVGISPLDAIERIVFGIIL